MAHNGALVLLTHQRAEGHYGEETLQENPKRVHQGAILTTPVIGTWRLAGGRRRVSYSQPRSSWTCHSYLSELGQHVDTTYSSHWTEGVINNDKPRSPQKSSVKDGGIFSLEGLYSFSPCIRLPHSHGSFCIKEVKPSRKEVAGTYFVAPNGLVCKLYDQAATLKIKSWYKGSMQHRKHFRARSGIF